MVYTAEQLARKRVRDAAYRARHREELRERDRAYRAAHVEEGRESDRRYRASHREERNAAHNAWRRREAAGKYLAERIRDRMSKVWIGVCAEGEGRIREYLSNARAKWRYHFAEWFNAVRRDIGYPHVKMRGMYGEYRLVPDFGI